MSIKESPIKCDSKVEIENDISYNKVLDNTPSAINIRS